MRILTVDDDEVIHELIAQILRTSGYEDVTLAGGAVEAIEAIKTAPADFDCILLDIQMPEIDGIQLCSVLRQVPGYERTPVIMLTAMSQKGYVDEAFQAGATDYVTKPFEPQELLSRLRVAEMLLSERRRADEAAQAEAARDFADPLTLREAPGVVSPYALENYLAQMSRLQAWRTCAFGVRIGGAKEVFAATDSTGFADFLSDVAESMRALLDDEESFVAYVGSGTYLVVGQKGKVPDRNAFTQALRQVLADPARVRRPDPALRLDALVGPPVGPRPLQANTHVECLRRALERLDDREPFRVLAHPATARGKGAAGRAAGNGKEAVA